MVVPAFDEAGVIGGTVRRLRTELAKFESDLEIVVVDDGSTDRTAAEAREAGADLVLELGSNRGKGAAVRAGMLAASGRTVAFTDADLAYAPDQVAMLADLVEEGWDVVVGSRHTDGAVTEVATSRIRQIGGWGVNRLVRLVVGDHSDTQCGVKAFRSDVARLIFTDGRVDGFGFDVEIFAIAERHGLSLLAAPVRVVNSTRSTVRVVHDGLALAADLVRIGWHLRRGGYTAAGADGLPPARPGC
ncbi:MAG: glycosyltransferase [Acidimicrobiia bacterium]|nr:glycosyltransferase [Acidimicrobiia bacterium]